ncbi:MAG: hypothetical protein COU31_02355 [Candidatus Magasanikbacteria bacterium CG10_big_fil_rev_8_21_14_0_10_40_10]|uniref:Shikimate kinase n=1 Tax=Candidatus Magasanikbacteria bacterium CG10_big_fil_rev_8_21_14_0_10_40_10 TaxID=1974648 RepID=A0A2M6W432_9BACT|nr:MAG: hypothetical protein COU31_02355 [Candidatus Magasanikbacteria bacterium CG10_big_fil_rev_8_21_14_0_10_40_10]
MTQNQKHILLIGFKHAGKTSVGRFLSEKMEKPFVDLDEKIEEEFAKQKGQKLSVRQIVLQEGLDNFRQLENEVLTMVLNLADQHIVALGGGTPINDKNRELIVAHQVVHITADKSNIYERIMINGRPAFFNEDEDPYMAFRRVWDEREHIYDEIAQITVNNNDELERPVNELERIFNNLM